MYDAPMTFVPDQPRPERVEVPASSAELALLTRAAALEHVDLPRFLLEAAHHRAKSVVAGVERITLSERDSLRVMELLENPPEPPARLIEAARLRLLRA